MDKLKNYDIEFSGLKVGKHEFSFEVDESFFQLFDTEQEFEKPKIQVDVLLDKHSTFLEFYLKIGGSVTLFCDITTEAFPYNLGNETKFLVKFGEEYNDDNEEIITIPHQDHAFNIAQLIYESTMLAIPMKKISPNVTEEDLEIIEKYSPKMEEEEEEMEIDARWEALKNLKK